MAAEVQISPFSSYSVDGNRVTFTCGSNVVRVDLCTPKMVRVRSSQNGVFPSDSDPMYYMVQKYDWPQVPKTVTDEGAYIKIETEALVIRAQKSPFRLQMFDKDNNLILKDSDTKGMYWGDGGKVGVYKTEGAGSGGIFGFGTQEKGRSIDAGGTFLNKYDKDINDFTMSHGQLIAPFFMSTVGYGVFLNTVEKNTLFRKHGGGFETVGKLDYYFIYGPDFKEILEQYSELTGRMELYGKWAHGFMLSKYGNDNATQEEFSIWINRLRNEDYPTDAYLFDYGWRGNKWDPHRWNSTRFPNLPQMFAEARQLGFHVGLHNNQGTPEANNGVLTDAAAAKVWADAHINNVVAPGYGDMFWPDEFDVDGDYNKVNLSAKVPYDAWKAYTDQSRPMFMVRGSYANQHHATTWSGDIASTFEEMGNQIGYQINAGLVGYWAVSHDLGGFLKKPTDELYTRWVAEFGAWCSLMRAHGHDGREPWLYSETAQDTLRKNLKTRYRLYPYTYSLAWQGYRYGTPIQRAMILEDGSQNNSAAWNVDKQFYYGDWFLVAPALEGSATNVSIWLPPNTRWYDYNKGLRYEGGNHGKTIAIRAELDEIPVLVKAGAIIPMGPDVDYADEKPLDPVTLDIYPHGHSEFTLYEDDGKTRNYMTKNAYSLTKYECDRNGNSVSFKINARECPAPEVYSPYSPRSYMLMFNHIGAIDGANKNAVGLTERASLEELSEAAEGYYHDAEAKRVYVRFADTGEEMLVDLVNAAESLPDEGPDIPDLPTPTPTTPTSSWLEPGLNAFPNGDFEENFKAGDVTASAGASYEPGVWPGSGGRTNSTQSIMLDLNNMTLDEGGDFVEVKLKEGFAFLPGRKYGVYFWAYAPEHPSGPDLSGGVAVNLKWNDKNFGDNRYNKLSQIPSGELSDQSGWKIKADIIDMNNLDGYALQPSDLSGLPTVRLCYSGGPASSPRGTGLFAYDNIYITELAGEPAIRAVKPGVTGIEASYIDVKLQYPIKWFEFSGAGIVVSGQGGNAAISGAEVLNDRQTIRISFAQPIPLGEYTVTLGEDVIDLWDRPFASKTAAFTVKEEDAFSGSAHFVRKYEAEEALLVPGQGQPENNKPQIAVDHTGYSGTGFLANWKLMDGRYAEFTVTVPRQGEYDVILRYANGRAGVPRTASLYVNGSKVSPQISMPSLANWDTWGDAVMRVSLESGENKIKVQIDSTDNGEFNLDYIQVQDAAVNAFGRIEAEAFVETSVGARNARGQCSEGGNSATALMNGDWIKFSNVDFGSGETIRKFEARVKASGGSGNLEVWVDSMYDQRAAVVEVPAAPNWTDVLTSCQPINGVHDVYLKYIAEDGASLDINWLRFNNRDVQLSQVTLNQNRVTGYIGNNLEQDAAVKLIGALYNPAGTLKDVVIKDKTLTAGEQTQFFDDIEFSAESLVLGDSIKIFIIDSLNAMAPLCNSAVISLSTFRVEAEYADTNATISSKAVASGGKYVGGLDDVGKYVEVTVAVPESRDYNVYIGYANGKSSAATRSVYVNGNFAQRVTFDKTGNWNTFIRRAPITLRLNAGVNTIRIQTDADSVQTIDVDYIEVN